MKPRLLRLGIGAAGGAVLLLIFWLLGEVAHIIAFNLQDSSFFLGLVLFLIGLLMIVRGGPSSKYVVGMGSRNSHMMQAAVNPDLAMEKKPKQAKDPKEVRTAPYVCMGAGLVNLLVCALTLLFE